MTTRKRGTRKARLLSLKPTLGAVRADVAPHKTARPILIATDGSTAAGAAIKFARTMDQAGAWAPEAVTVVEHLPLAVADFALPAPVFVADPASGEGLVSAVHRQLVRFGGKAWSFRSETGSAAASIVDLAKERNVEMIVLGLGKHGKLARLFGAETAARVCRHTDVPVLAVDHRARGRPQTVVAAMDFGASSVRAAREALDLLGPGGRIHLLHVRWALNGRALQDDEWERTYALGVERGFQRLAKELARAGITVTSELRRGAVLKSILQVATELDADLIVAGSHGQTVVDRLLLGSTPAHLLRAAKCSVLIAPPVTNQEL